MSNALAIAAVTAVMKDLLNNGLIDHNVTGVTGTSVTVTAMPPDRVVTTGQTENSQLNLFLHQVTPNTGWRNVSLPSRNGRGRRLTNPPLALDLHYLLTAYGAEDLHAEILLGYAMQLFHETSVLTRDAIRTSLIPEAVDGTILPTALQALASSDLADQVEQIKITPSFLNTEEMSKLWSALQTNYRPTTAYRVSVVLIEAQAATRNALPVLTIGADDAGVAVSPDLVSPLPAITDVRPPNGQPTALLGDILTIIGHHLDGANITVRCTNPRLVDPLELNPEPGGTASQLAIRLPDAPAVPDAPADWPAGVYTAAVLVQKPGELFRRVTNEIAFTIAPRMTLPPTSVARDPVTGDVTITLECSPEVRTRQRASLILAGREIIADPHPTQTNQLTFSIGDTAPGAYVTRLRIDGVDSHLIDRSAVPPEFDTTQSITIPA